MFKSREDNKYCIIDTIAIQCDDHQELITFHKCIWEDKSAAYYEINAMDAETWNKSGNRFVRAWKAFWGKPIYHSGIYTDKKEKIAEWLEECRRLCDE